MANSIEKDFRSDSKFLYDVTRANLRLLSRQPQNPVDVALFHNHAEGDYTGLNELIAGIIRRHMVNFIAVTNNEGERVGSDVKFEANPGKTECIRILREDFKIPSGKIRVPYMEARHTRQENTSFVEFSAQRGWKSAVIIAQPHRLLRAMLGTVQQMTESLYWMEVYTAAPIFTPWLEKAMGSQGKKYQARMDHIEEELERIYLRQSTNELASFEELFTYLETRGKGSSKLRRNLPPELQGGAPLS